MARAAAKDTAANDERLRLIDALKFAAAAIEKTDVSGLSAFVTISNGIVTAQNDTFALGIKTVTDLDLCLHGEKLLAALNQCTANFQMVQISPQELSVKSGSFRAIVPVLPSDTVQPILPDAPVGALGKPVTDGLEICARLCVGKGDRAFDQSVLFKDQTIVATNGGLAIEYWHGFGMPGGQAMPKKAVDCVIKLKKPVVSFGFSENSLTIFFDDESFIKTRLNVTPWPDTDGMFFKSTPSVAPVPLWKGFADGLKALEKFIENDLIVFRPDMLATHTDLNHAAASYKVPGLPNGHKFSAAYWRIILPFAEQIFIAPVGSPWAFTSKNLRGLIIGKH